MKVATSHADTVGTDGAHQPHSICIAHTAFQGSNNLLATGKGDYATDYIVRRILFNGSCRFAGFGVAHDRAAFGVGSSLRDSSQLQRLAVGPPCVTIETLKVY